jgi:rubrerythrin
MTSLPLPSFMAKTNPVGRTVMAKFRDSQTAKNLLTSFAGESQARNRYTYFARRAMDEGYIQIADIFEETAGHECEHALRFFKFFNGGELAISASFPAGVIDATYANLLAAAAGERFEHTELYPGFARIAREEGFDRAADTWEAISVSEKQHEKRYRELAANLLGDRVFVRDQETVWRCRNCGYLHTGEAAPEKCPACVKPQSYFELLAENW